MNDQHRSLPQIVYVDEDKCINCHACIAICPVKFCNDGSGDHVTVNDDTCIGCGRCLSACTHDARRYIDDFSAFMNDIGDGEKMVAIIPPAAAANFPEQYLRLNGWLKSLGVDAVFDVSFGAELSARSYAEHVKNDNPEMVITQPCPAIVTYIEIYQPELLPYLAPVDSPMLHTIKMIRRFYPEYTDHRVAVISPCLAKKREFTETGQGDYNVAFLSLVRHFDESGISLDDYPEVEFDNPPAERAVLFSSPGGLLRTMERWFPGISDKTRKIEGNPHIYEYLKKMPAVLAGEKGMSPLLVDCLNCEMGCNGGPLTPGKEKSPDEIEYWIERRNAEMRERYSAGSNDGAGHAEIEKAIDRYWEPGLYARTYRDLSSNAEIRIPGDQEREEIYRTMHKYSEADIYNCSSCGYGRCEHMATAIFNGLNRPENCHHYLESEREVARRKIAASERRLRNILETTVEGFWAMDRYFRTTAVNPSMAGILGVAVNELSGASVFDFMDGDTMADFRNRMNLCSENRNSSYEISLRRKDGTHIICFFQATSLFDENGECAGSFAMVTDITERKHAEEELKNYRDHLEELVQDRTHELELNKKALIDESHKIRNLLDNAGEGFLSFGSDLIVRPEYSAECITIFGSDIAGKAFPVLLYPDEPDQQNFVLLTLEKVYNENDASKSEVYLSLMPEEVTIGERIIAVTCKLVYEANDEGGRHFMVVLNDITEKRELEHQMVRERNNLRLVAKAILNFNDFNSILEDFHELVTIEAVSILRSATTDKLAAAIYAVYKDVHTLKGNFSQFYMLETTRRLHELEDRLQELLDQENTTAEDAIGLFDDPDMVDWVEEDLDILKEMVGDDFFKNDAVITIEKKKILEIEQKIASILLPEEAAILINEISKLRFVPFQDLIRTYPEYVMSLADRYEKLIIQPVIEGDSILVDPDRYQAFTKSLVHVYRNIIEHGIESPDERLDGGKDEYGAIITRFSINNGNRLQLTITDDGRGIDTDAIRKRAIERRAMSSDDVVTNDYLHSLIFAEGISTSQSVSELSGRGIGLSAVKSEIDKLGGNIIVSSEKGKGTSFGFTVPLDGDGHVDGRKKKLMEYMVKSTQDFFAGELTLETRPVDGIQVLDSNRLSLYDMSSVIDTTGEIVGNIIITVEKSLADFILRQLILDEPAEDEVEELTRETIGEVLNIVLGNTTNALEEDGIAIEINSPGNMEFHELEVQFDEKPLSCTFDTPEGKCRLVVCKSVIPVKSRA